MITVRGWHGTLSPQKSAKMDAMAKEIAKPRFEWEFDGSIGEFAAKWGLPFLAYPQVETREWLVFITDYPSFQAR